MPHVVCEPCYGCKYTECAPVCPVEAFREAEKMLYIDPGTCIDCEACVPMCPVGAIYSDQSGPEKWRRFIQENAEQAPKLPMINQKKPRAG